MKQEKAKYQIVKDHIISCIKNGTYSPAEKIPSENVIAGMFDISRQTVRQAMSRLVSEGVIRRVQGLGTFVCGNSAAGRNRKKMAGVIMTYPDGYAVPYMIMGISGELEREGYGTVVRYTGGAYGKERECIEYFLEQDIAGLVIEPAKSTQASLNTDLFRKLSEKDLPFVYINGYPDGEECSYAAADDEKAGYIAAMHLIENGHRVIAGIFGNDDMQGAKRYAGFAKALEMTGIDFEGRVLLYSADESGGFLNGEYHEKVIALIKGATGIVVDDGRIAEKLIGMLKTKWIRIPEDLSVVAFDDPMDAGPETSLTSVGYPICELGAAAGKNLLSLIKGNAVRRTVIEPALHIRRSVKNILLQTEEDRWESIV